MDTMETDTAASKERGETAASKKRGREKYESEKASLDTLTRTKDDTIDLTHSDDDNEESMESVKPKHGRAKDDRAYGYKTDYDDDLDDDKTEDTAAARSTSTLGSDNRTIDLTLSDDEDEESMESMESLESPQGLGPQGRVSSSSLSSSLADESLDLDDSESEMDSDAAAAEQSQEWIDGDDEQDLPQVEQSFYADNFMDA
jgi:hypothetical protein